MTEYHDDKHHDDKHDYDKYKDVFYFNGEQDVDQANDANVDQVAFIAQVADVDQELNQAVVQNNDQSNAVLVEGGDDGLLDFVFVDASNENNQLGFNIGANVSDVDQDQDAEIEQEQEVDIGQFNFANQDLFG